jgi:hypothetical protein
VTMGPGLTCRRRDACTSPATSDLFRPR